MEVCSIYEELNTKIKSTTPAKLSIMMQQKTAAIAELFVIEDGPKMFTDSSRKLMMFVKEETMSCL